MDKVDLRDFFFRLRVGGGGGTKKRRKKSSENDQLTGHFQSFYLFFNISRTNGNTSKVNQQSILDF